MGSLLMSLGLSYEFVASKAPKGPYRLGLGIGLLGAFLLFWVNAAVGLIGNEGQTVNLLYGSVYGVGLVGAILARLRPAGMARTLALVALTQMLVPVVGWLIWPPPATSWAPSIGGVLALSGGFAGLFAISAALFWRATKPQ